MTKPLEDFSQSFYPFLHEASERPQELTDELRFSLMQKARESVEVKERFFEQNKYGILDAMYLPGTEAPVLPPSMSSVNTFRLVLGAYLGADLPLLPDRSFTSASKLRPYDLTDITDRLAEDP